MSKTKEQRAHRKVEKRTAQGGNPPKTSSMNKSARRSFKTYRGQGK